ncbi:fidgetin-like protein 1 [Hemiscyllium ocellatum]|uniref:fidgetin-like protein 1 n=1 Tax=Hemiscyllium ocellatum TaxID=170820 RepID=UPI00296702D3|nr:fidgetin-like protein 1 [Hemiscyllium ocellatum]XP_060681475.1 fidgetin-like protein 1 [Hemiscyllium ocellatum]
MQPADEVHLSEWQKHYFNITSNDCTPGQKADAYRGQILQLQYAWANSDISWDCTANSFRRCTEKYAAIIDSDDAKIGLNNYAGSILSLSRCQKNESNQWQSSLTENNIFKLKSVQEMFKSSKIARDLLVPTSDASIVVGKTNSVENLDRHKIETSPIDTKDSVPKIKNVVLCSDVLSRNVNENYSSDKYSTSAFTCPKMVQGLSAAQSVTDDSSSLKSTGTLSSTISKNLNGDPLFGLGKEAYCTIPQVGTVTGQCTPLNGNLAPDAPGSTSKRKSSQISRDGNSHTDMMYGHFQNRNWTNYKQKNFDNMTRNTKSEDSSIAAADEGLITCFKTAKEQLHVVQQKKFGNQSQSQRLPVTTLYNSSKKSLGTVRSRGLFGKFVSPVSKQDNGDENGGLCSVPQENNSSEASLLVDERLKNLEPKMIQLIMSEIMDHGPPVNWDDIAGLEFAKTTIKEIVVWPMLRPDIFTGLRGPPKGILLFGPPGTGKTLIGKCIACQSGATFFSISASSLTSKWVGEGEKMVRAMFAVARCHQPAVIFIDEIDSLLSQRVDGEHDSSRRIKTEFLVQLDGAATSADDRILVVGATNRPQEIDEAARRRLVKRLYIPLPEMSARRQIVMKLMSHENCSLNPEEMELIIEQSEGYSGADMTQLCREAALGPIRSIQIADISTITPDQVRPIAFIDFKDALVNVRPSVSLKDLELYEEWNKTFGCGR